MAGHAARSRRLLIILVATIGCSLVAPAAVGAHSELVAGTPPEQDSTRAFTLDLSARGDFVAQTDFVRCVGASMQMMLNMIQPQDDRTATTQGRLQVLARSLSGPRPDGTQRKGASVRGWTAGLNVLDAGPYRTVGMTDLDAVLKVAARAIRETGRPVGLLVWRGRHAWVMAGFTATADPAVTDDFRVTRAIVLDPLYPYGSKVWGPSPRPRQALTVAQLGRQFVPRRSGTSGAAAAWAQGFNGKYVIVMPAIEIRVARLSHAAR